MSESGFVFDIQRYCLHDGPGIRTVVFLKGCPLSCLWCANPESQKPAPELMLTSLSCIDCHSCLEVCPNSAISLKPSNLSTLRPVIDWSVCDGCLKCVDVCPTGSLKRVGREMSTQEVLEAIKLDQPFYARSDGGVTLSGGEPTMQPAFTHAILQHCKNLSIHTAMETSGYCEWDTLSLLTPFCNVVFFDLKHLQPEAHRRHTGKSNKQILTNLELLIASHANVIVRLPLVPGYNDGDEHLLQFASYLRSLRSGLTVEVIPYHQWGCSKYERLGRSYSLKGVKPVAQVDLTNQRRLLESHGVLVI